MRLEAMQEAGTEMTTGGGGGGGPTIDEDVGPWSNYIRLAR